VIDQQFKRVQAAKLVHRLVRVFGTRRSRHVELRSATSTLGKSQEPLASPDPWLMGYTQAEAGQRYSKWAEPSPLADRYALYDLRHTSPPSRAP
jgi:hypothetical protein